MQSIREIYRIGRGPSSSHTMGPERACKQIKERFPNADRYQVVLYGSLAMTGAGHGTDRVIRETLEPLAGEVIFDRKTPTVRHPNMMDITLFAGEKTLCKKRVWSVGGGAILVNTINGMEVDLQGESPTIVIRHTDLPGVIAGVSGILSERGQNIASMRVYRRSAGGDAIMALEMDAVPPEEVLARLRELTHIHKVVLLGRL